MIVYFALCSFADGQRLCWPSVGRLARMCDINRRTAQRALRALENAGLVAIEPRKTQRGAASVNTYRLIDRAVHRQGGTSAAGRQSCHGEVTPATPYEGGNGDAGEAAGVPPKQDQLNKETKRNQTKGARERGETSLPIPAALDTEEFIAKWSEWLTYRRKRRLTVLPETLAKQLDQLAAVGATAAIETIESSITNGWVGIFPNGGSKHGRKTHQIGAGQQHDPDAAKRDPNHGKW